MIDELKNVSNDPEQTSTPEQEAVYKRTILSLQELLLLRYNEATLKMLKVTVTVSNMTMWNNSHFSLKMFGPAYFFDAMSFLVFGK